MAEDRTKISTVFSNLNDTADQTEGLQRDWMNRCSDECISRDRLETETTRRMWNIFPMLFEKRRKALQKYSEIFRAFVDTDFLLQIEEERDSFIPRRLKRDFRWDDRPKKVVAKSKEMFHSNEKKIRRNCREVVYIVRFVDERRKSLRR